MNEVAVRHDRADDVYRINTPDVVAQVIDGEALLIAFETGAYYSARGTGGFIVEAIQRGIPKTHIVAELARGTGQSLAVVEHEVTSFLSWLGAEGLITRAPPVTDAPAEPCMPTAPVRLDPATAEKYTDLEDLLLLDPIHDVDAAGWPIAKARA